MKATKKAEKITLKNGQFLVNAEYSIERMGDYDRRNKIQTKWENYSGHVDGCGNCHHDFYFDLNKQSFVFSEESKHNDDNIVSMYKTMSPALLLYRLIATFFGTPICEDGYKSIWSYSIRHIETGKLIGFSEWKGAIGFWLPDTDSRKLNKQFKADLIELMNYICSNECAHPYDGLVAGGVA